METTDSVRASRSKLIASHVEANLSSRFALSKTSSGYRQSPKLKDRITPQVNFFQKHKQKVPAGRGRKDRQRRFLEDRGVKRLYVQSCVWQVLWEIVCDKVVCERWCVTMLRVTKLCLCVCACVRVWCVCVCVKRLNRRKTSRRYHSSS